MQACGVHLRAFRCPEMQFSIAFAYGGDSSELVRTLFHAVVGQVQALNIGTTAVPRSLRAIPDADWHASASLLGQKGPGSTYPWTTGFFVTKRDGHWTAEFPSRTNVHKKMFHVLKNTDDIAFLVAEKPTDILVANSIVFCNSCVSLCSVLFSLALPFLVRGQRVLPMGVK